ncbi:MAG: tyrosine-type recombinase/integrase [Metallibacterium scheffleri]
MQFAIEAALRQGELLALRWKRYREAWTGGFPPTAPGSEARLEARMQARGHRGVHFHDLRNGAASRLAEKLPNLIELAAVTGHKDLRMLKRYYHPRASDLAKKLG